MGTGGGEERGEQPTLRARIGSRESALVVLLSAAGTIMDRAETLQKVLALAAEKKVRWPKTWEIDEHSQKLIKKAAFDLMMSSKADDGSLDVDMTVEKLIDKFGVAKERGEKRKTEEEAESSEVKEEKGGEEEEGDEDEEDADGKKKKKKATKKSKKVPEEEKKSNSYACEANRDFGDQILKEFAAHYFSSADPGEKRKGGIFSKAAKAFREVETPVTNKKEAMALPGVGKGIAAYLEEFKANGFCEKLEKLRAGDT